MIIHSENKSWKEMSLATTLFSSLEFSSSLAVSCGRYAIVIVTELSFGKNLIILINQENMAHTVPAHNEEKYKEKIIVLMSRNLDFLLSCSTDLRSEMPAQPATALRIP